MLYKKIRFNNINKKFNFRKYDFSKILDKSKPVNYFKQYETRDFNHKKKKRNFVNYHLTKEFKDYKPNYKN